MIPVPLFVYIPPITVQILTQSQGQLFIQLGGDWG